MANWRQSFTSFAAGLACDGEITWNSAVRQGQAISSMFRPSCRTRRSTLVADEPCEAVVVRSGQDPVVVNLDIEIYEAQYPLSIILVLLRPFGSVANTGKRRSGVTSLLGARERSTRRRRKWNG